MLRQEKEKQLVPNGSNEPFSTSYCDKYMFTLNILKGENGPERKLAQVLISLSQNTETSLSFYIPQI